MAASVASTSPSQLRVWLLASRPATLPAAVVPVLVGSAAAAGTGHFRPFAFVAAFLASLLIQIGTNFANDYFDYCKGADAGPRLGPVRVTQSGLATPESVRNATALTFGLAALCGAYLVAVGGWPILAVGLLSIAAGVLYTGGPWPLGYHGLGDLFVFVFFGLIGVVGTVYVHGAAVSGATFVHALPVGCLVTAILVVNNLRDIDGDRAAGKGTLAVRIGRRATRAQYFLLVAGAFLVPLVRWVAEGGSVWFWLPWLTLPLAIGMVRTVFGEQGPALNRALKGTGQLHLLFGVLFAVSLLV